MFESGEVGNWLTGSIISIMEIPQIIWKFEGYLAALETLKPQKISKVTFYT